MTIEKRLENALRISKTIKDGRLDPNNLYDLQLHLSDAIEQAEKLSIHSVVNSNCDSKPKKCKHKYGLFTHINNGNNLMFKCEKCKRDMTYEQLQIERKEK